MSIAEESQKKKNLGRGLAALLGDEPEDLGGLDKNRAQRTIAVDLIQPNRYQPRRYFEPAALAELASSIKDRGVLQPIIVRRLSGNTYELIAGERRWRASQMAGLREIPAIIKDLTDGEALQIALIENIQRQDLNGVEEAEAYQRLIAEFNYTQEELGTILGKSRATITNTLRLLQLPPEVRMLVVDGKLSFGHARTLVGCPDAATLAAKIIAENLSVRATERLVRASNKPISKQATRLRDPNLTALEKELETVLGLKVHLSYRGNSGNLTIHYTSLDQLDTVLRRLMPRAS